MRGSRKAPPLIAHEMILMAREMIMMEHERILMAHEMILMARELILTEHEVILMELSRITETASWLKERLPVPDVVVVLGSGLGELAEQVESPTVIPYADVPHFPVSTVSGHAGQLVSGVLKGKKVLMMQGRCHWYEGYDIQEVVRPVRILAALGAKTFILTNAAGCLNRQYQVGQFMFITDHINLTGLNPLRGPNLDQFGIRFPDMSAVYDQELITLGEKIAVCQGTITQRGIYAWYQGPSFETPAEIRMFTMLGADAIGMSTVPEAIAIRHMGRRVLGISCLTNMAAGILPQPITGEEVMETARRVRPHFKALITGIIQSL